MANTYSKTNTFSVIAALQKRFYRQSICSFFVQAHEETQKKNLAQENESLRRQLKAFGNKSELMESVM